MTITTFEFTLLFTYAALLAAFTFASVRQRRNKPDNSATIGISIVVALRNEENNVEALVKSLLVQQYPQELFEIILVDDHSTDDTISRIPTHPQVKVVRINNDSQGKKAALKAGISAAQFPFAALTDADCRPTPFWLGSLASLINREEPTLIAGPVAMQHSQGLISAFQYWELEILQTVTHGSAALGFPTMCNGANLLISTTGYQNANLKEGKSSSGDDMFLLHHFLKQNWRVIFTRSSNAIVYTFPESTFMAMLQQQLRWASKSKHYQHPTTIALGIITFLTNAGLVLLTILTSLGRCTIELLLYAFWIKVMAEAASAYFPRQIVRGKKPSIFSFLLSSLAMPFYATFVAIASTVVKIRWKGRTIV